MGTRKRTQPPVYVASDVYAGVEDHTACIACGHYAAHHVVRIRPGKPTGVACWDCPCTVWDDGQAPRVDKVADPEPLTAPEAGAICQRIFTPPGVA